MDYAAHYDRLIERARGRVLQGYRERHHVVPRCLGGGNEPANIVALTAEEHYVAHQLLVRMHPHNGRLAHAAVWMAKRTSGNKAYGWLRRRSGAESSKTMKGRQNWLGKKHTDEWRAAMSARLTGRKMPAEGIEKMAATKRGKKLSPLRCAQLSALHKGVPKSPEHRAKIAASHIGIGVPQAARDKIAEANRNRVFTAETRERMSLAHKGKAHGPMPQWHRDKISATKKAKIAATASASTSPAPKT